MRNVLLFACLVVGGSLLSVLIPVLVVWVWIADLFNALWRYLWK